MTMNSLIDHLGRAGCRSPVVAARRGVAQLVADVGSLCGGEAGEGSRQKEL